MFAKLFDTAHGQVAVLRQDNEDSEPEIRFYNEPEGLGVCSIAIGFGEDQYEAQEKAFENVTQEMAESAASQLHAFSGV